MPQNLYLNETDTAAYLAVAPKTLSRWRWSGKGPVFRKFGSAVRYSVADLEAYAADAAVAREAGN